MRRVLCFTFVVFSIAFSIFTVLRILLTFHLLDFNVYYTAVQLFLGGKNPYIQTGSNLAFIYPPTTLFFLTPFGILPYWLAEKTWTVVSFTALITSILLLSKSIKTRVPVLQILLIFSFAIIAFPSKFTLGMGQINFFVLLLLSLAFYCFRKKRQFLAGSLLATATAIKLTPIVVVAFFLKKGNYKLVISFAMTIVLFVALSTTIFGKELMKEYFFNVLPNIPTVGNNIYYNQALTGFLARLGIINVSARVINYSTLILLITISFVLTKRKLQKPLVELAQYGLFIISVLIAGGLTWQHHLVLLIIPFTALFFILKRQKKISRLISLLSLLSYLLVAYNIKTPETFSGNSTLLLSHALYGSTILFVLLAITLRKDSVVA